MELTLETLQAIAIDLDGTMLKSDFTMGERTQEILYRCMDKGLQLLLSTGRSPVAAEPYRRALGLSGPMVFYNGAAVVDVPENKLLSGTLLNANVASYCVSLAKKQNLHFHAFLPGDTLVHGGFRPEAEAYEKRTGLRGELKDMAVLFAPGGEAEGGCIKAMFIAPSPVLEGVRKELLDRFDGQIYVTHSHVTFLELMASGVSKGRALKQALELRGLDPQGVLALGDGENDIPMAELVGFFAAPDNAAPAVLNRAMFRTPSNDEEGPAAFLEQLLSGEKIHGKAL